MSKKTVDILTILFFVSWIVILAVAGYMDYKSDVERESAVIVCEEIAVDENIKPDEDYGESYELWWYYHNVLGIF